MKLKWGVVRLAVMALFLVGTMNGCLGCGGGGLKMQVDNTQEAPVFIGIYLLSKDSALTERANADLTNKDIARTLGPGDGVIDYEVRPVYLDTPITFSRDKYDSAVTSVLIVANVPKPGPCARLTLPIGKANGVKISVVDKCLKIVKK